MTKAKTTLHELDKTRQETKLIYHYCQHNPGLREFKNVSDSISTGIESTAKTLN